MSTAEFVVLTPIMVLLMAFLPVQIGLWWHARHVATAAATQGARVAAQSQGKGDQQGNPADGEQAARDFLSSAKAVTSYDVAVVPEGSAGQRRMTARVRISAGTVLPGVTFTTTAEASNLVEVFRPIGP